jgi:hypothetical protein
MRNSTLFLYFYESFLKSRGMGWAENAASIGDKGHAYNILVGKPEGKTPLGG